MKHMRLPVILLVGGGILLGALYLWIEYETRTDIFSAVNDVPYNDTALVLGTAEDLSTRGENPYFTYQIDAVVELFEAEKIRYVIVSGDNGTKGYNEPQAMKDALVAQGIPEKNIYTDYAGFDTYDSVVRSKEIFDQSSLTIVSQPFHIKRALYIAQAKGIQAIGYAAEDVEGSRGAAIRTREVFARVKAWIDIVFNREPRYLGENIQVGK